jgi:DNA recombination protein RmuC
MEMLYLAIGLLAGIIIMAVLMYFRFGGNVVPKALHELVQKQFDELQAQYREKLKELEQLNADVAASERTVELYHEKLKFRQQEIEQLRTEFQREFENMANRLLDEKSKRFTELNKQSIEGLIAPMREHMQEFEKRMSTAHIEETKQRSTLSEQLRYMAELNQQMSEDAKGLTKALKGDSKAQGNWGELILERVLEKSGLVKGREYSTQQSLSGSEGERRIPDVLINLPDNKHLVVDSKVSLVAYERYVASQDEVEQQRYLAEHILSIRNHIKQLSEKNYPALYGINSPDFVLLFIPIEPAFSLAMSSNYDLFSEAFDRHIVLVTPTTLLATTRTIASLWRQENQNRNAQEIARLSGLMFDKFVNFVEDLNLVGDRLDQAQKTLELAVNRLHTGKGSLSSRAQRLKELGAKSTKNLPNELLLDNVEHDDEADS